MAEPTTMALLAVAKSKAGRYVIGGILFFLLGVVLTVIFLLSAAASLFSDDDPSLSGGLSAQTLSYRETVEECAEKYGIPEYADLVLAVIQVKSGGMGTDIMQSSRSPYNISYPRERNGILDPLYSIECGIQLLKECIVAAGCSGADDFTRIAAAAQGYEFGTAYISWLTLLGEEGYTQDNAKAFLSSLPESEQTAAGDFAFASLVMRIYENSVTKGFFFPIPDYTGISSPFGTRTVNPITGELGEFHKGADFPAPYGTPVLAIADGKVLYSGYSPSYGQHLLLEHAGGFTSLYAHCSALLAGQGEYIARGQEIALCGSTGQSTGSHLHLEIRYGGVPVNPMEYLGVTTITGGESNGS